MEKYDVRFKKRFGQNFLKDINVVKRIVDVSGVNEKSLVIEVGPGGAIMTRELASRVKNVLAYEIDDELSEELYKRIEDFSNVDVLFQDFLEADLLTDVRHYKNDNIYFVSNVPYYITTPILLKLLQSGIHFKKIVMMVQKEVGERFCTAPGSREYGSITVLLNYFYNIKKEFNVSRKQFIPEPNVDSMIVSFTEKDDKLKLNDFKLFERILKDSFQFKRKTIRNNLKQYDLKVIEKVLAEYDYDLNVRAEMLEVEVFVEIANALSK